MSEEINFYAAMKARSEGKTIGTKREGCYPEWFKHDEPIKIMLSHAEDLLWQVKQEPRTFYVNIYAQGGSYLHDTKALAIAAGRGHSSLTKVVQIVEVFDEEKLK